MMERAFETDNESVVLITTAGDRLRRRALAAEMRGEVVEASAEKNVERKGGRREGTAERTEKIAETTAVRGAA